MHELSVVKTLIDKITDYRQSAKHHTVTTVTVDVGALTCIDAGRLQFCFDMVKETADMANTTLTIHHVPARATCNDCGRSFMLSHWGAACPCGGHDHKLLSGTELLLTEIEFA